MLATINGTSCRQNNAELLHLAYAPGALNNDIAKDGYRSHYIFITQSQGIGKLTLQFMVKKSVSLDTPDALNQLTESLANGRVSIVADGFTYFATLSSIGVPEIVTRDVRLITYELSAIKCKAKVTEASLTVDCSSTVPLTDCVVTLTAGASGTSLMVKNEDTNTSVTITTAIAQDDVIVIDGLNNKITLNGNSVVQYATFRNLIKLQKGTNTLQTSGTTLSAEQVEYYPTFY